MRTVSGGRHEPVSPASLPNLPDPPVHPPGLWRGSLPPLWSKLRGPRPPRCALPGRTVPGFRQPGFRFFHRGDGLREGFRDEFRTAPRGTGKRGSGASGGRPPSAPAPSHARERGVGGRVSEGSPPGLAGPGPRLPDGDPAIAGISRRPWARPLPGFRIREWEGTNRPASSRALPRGCSCPKRRTFDIQESLPEAGTFNRAHLTDLPLAHIGLFADSPTQSPENRTRTLSLAGAQPPRPHAPERTSGHGPSGRGQTSALPAL